MFRVRGYRNGVLLNFGSFPNRETALKVIADMKTNTKQLLYEGSKCERITPREAKERLK